MGRRTCFEISRFYPTLPSNSLTDYYAQNTVAQYTTNLNSLIELDVEWEVGLTEMSFPFEIENVVEGECYFIISQRGSNSSLKVTVPAGHYKVLDHLDMHMKVAAMRRIGLSSIELVPIMFTFLKSANRVRMRLHQRFTIEFGVILARLLGFRHDVTYSETSTLAESKMQFYRSFAPYTSTAIWRNMCPSETPKLRCCE